MKKIVCCILLLFTGYLQGHSTEVIISSPDGNIQMTVFDKDENVCYTVKYNDKPIILESLLGINGNGEWKNGIAIDKSENSSMDVTWKPVYGERNTIRDHYNQSEIDLTQTNNPRSRLKLIVRAYDEGIAFRYFFPDGEYLHITNEYTQYTMPEGTLAYFTRKAQATYNLLPLRNWPDESERPLVLELPQGPLVLLTEAEMVNYARTKFILASDKANTITGVMYGAVDDIAPYKTPWRVIMVAEKPGQLIENNDLLLNLNPPCEIEDVQWIRPGKVIREVTLSTEGGKNLVDFAVKHQLQYILFDAGWYGPEGSKSSDATTVTLDPARNKNPNALNLQEVIAYAREHGIGVMLYVNQRALYQQLDEILPVYKSWGIAGVKFGFVQVGSQFWTTWMHNAVKQCAKYGLMVDIHDEYRPTGFSRTYPNLMTQEGIYGNEEFPDATHNVTLPFTRFTQGAADYTICYYRQKWDRNTQADTGFGLVNARLLKTTSAHQLAMAVVYYSPLQLMYWYDKPSDSREEPELEFFDQVPTVWDDTKVIHGEIGKYISIARRSGDDWFVGTMTNNDARKVSIPLHFLHEGKTYLAHIYYDDPKVKTRTKVGIKTMKVTNKSTIIADMPASGGHAIWIESNKDGMEQMRKSGENKVHSSQSNLVTWPAPEGAALNGNFTVRVRQTGQEWKTIPSYLVNIDEVRDTKHHIEDASMAYFDFSGEVEISVTFHQDNIQHARIRPLSYNIIPEIAGNTLTFRLNKPCNLSVEINDDIFHNLHLFANPVEEFIPDPNDKNVIYFGQGIHRPEGGKIRVPSGKTLYLSGGAILMGQILVSHVRDVKILGRGIVDRSIKEGIRIANSKNVYVEGLICTQVPTGGSDSVTIHNVKSISYYGWGDGMNVFASNNVLFDGVFCRNSDDCTTVYATRKDFIGGCKNITMQNSTLWADVAHPIFIGIHGNPQRPDTIENVVYKNIDILDHKEKQIDYQGCLAINAGDNNLIRNVRFENIRIEDFRQGQLVNLRIFFNEKYCKAPGRGIEDIVFKDISYTGNNAEISIIAGYNEERQIKNIRFENLRINGQVISDDMPGKPTWYKTSDIARFWIGEFVKNVKFLK